MLPRSARLRKKSDFEQVYQRGRRITMEAFSVYALPREEGHPTRVGFVVGKRFRTHPLRNRAKRRLRAVVRALWHQIPPHHDWVFVAREPLLTMPYKMLVHQVCEALRKLASGESS